MSHPTRPGGPASLGHPTELLAAYAAGGLDGPDAGEVSAHLAGCGRCTADAASWRRISSAVRARAAEASAPAPGLFAAIRERVTAARPVPRYDGVIGGRPARRALGLFAHQWSLAGRTVWAYSAFILAVGMAVAALAPAGTAERVLARVVPLVTALAVAGACGSDRDPAGELVRATPTSRRTVLLARLTLVLGGTVAGGLITGLLVSLPMHGDGLPGVASAWYGPLVPLTALSFALSVLWRPAAGVGVAMALWLVRELSASGGVDHWLIVLVEPLWAPNAAVLVGAAVLTVGTVISAPLMPWHRPRRLSW
jgi:hypothetical protein